MSIHIILVQNRWYVSFIAVRALSILHVNALGVICAVSVFGHITDGMGVLVGVFGAVHILA